MDFKGKNVMVVGMARSGIASAKLLLSLGANVILHDTKSAGQLGIAQSLLAQCENCMGADPFPCMRRADILVLSPGVPVKQPFLEEAQRLGKPAISEIELGYLTAQAEFVAITGTNGKTTTTALTGELFKHAGKRTYVLGNIGVAITEVSQNTKKGDVIVAEVAALQLETIDRFHARAAALLNLTPDHMDRFFTMEYYTACKMRIFENQTERDYAVLNYDDPLVRGQAHKIKSKLFWFSRKTEVGQGAYLSGHDIIFKEGGKRDVVLDTRELIIPGSHNIENAMAAICLALAMKLPRNKVAEALRMFKGVEHRIEFVRKVNGVRFINDSKGTNVDATLKAIESMQAPTILILGGYDKHGSFDALFEGMSEYITGVVLLGATRQKLQEAAEKAGFSNVMLADTFEQAVLTAYRAANGKGNVLLSPACASWDMFDNFEQRGDLFKSIANRL